MLTELKPQMRFIEGEMVETAEAETENRDTSGAAM